MDPLDSFHLFWYKKPGFPKDRNFIMIKKLKAAA